MLPLTAPGLTIQAMPTIGDERTNSVFFDNVYVGDDYRVGELNKGFQYISEALDLERFTMFTFSPIEQRMEELWNYVRTAECDGTPLREDPIVRERMVQLMTETRWARMIGPAVRRQVAEGRCAADGEASEYKLYATELSQRLANRRWTSPARARQLRVHTEDAPLRGGVTSATGTR